MALIQCPDCLKQISDLAHSCPGCGRPVKFAQVTSPDGKEEGVSPENGQARQDGSAFAHSWFGNIRVNSEAMAKRVGKNLVIGWVWFISLERWVRFLLLFFIGMAIINVLNVLFPLPMWACLTGKTGISHSFRNIYLIFLIILTAVPKDYHFS